jgi:hypothetical protein
MLASNFKEGKDYKIYNNEEFKTIYHNENSSFLEDIEPNPKIKWHTQVKHIIISPDAFIRVCNTIRNIRASDFFAKLKNLINLYEEYKNIFQTTQLQNQIEEEKKIVEEKEILLREEQKKIGRIKSLYKDFENMEKNEYIYIATSRHYAERNIFKVGRTLNLKTRLPVYNSGRVDEDKMKFVYCIKCYDAKTAEQGIKTILRFCRIKKREEMYLLHFNHLKNIIEIYCLYINEMAERSNWLNDNKIDIYLNEQPIPFDDFDEIKE